MWRKYTIPLLAMVGLLVALFVVYRGLQKPTVSPVLFEPARSPYQFYVAAEGIIEAHHENSNLSVPFPELIVAVYHAVGDLVKKGEPLLKLDTRKLEADLVKALKDEELAKTDLANKANQFSYFTRLKEKSAVSEQAYAATQFDKELAENRLASASASVAVIKTNSERSIMRAPSDGKILQVRARPGEFANVNPFNGEALIVFGVTDYYQLRIDIDEVEAWRYKKGSAATAFLRGNSRIRIPLEYDHIEPYIVPKKSLSGSNTERVDTRVLQVIYRFRHEGYPVYVGQLLDVFIEAEPVGGR